MVRPCGNVAGKSKLSGICGETHPMLDFPAAFDHRKGTMNPNVKSN